MSAQSDYTAKHITVLEGLEPVRKRPAMYIGGTGTEGLHHLVWEVVDNAIDEAMAGFCDTIVVELLPNNRLRVKDNGRGIPIDIHPQTKKSALETVLTTLHAGGKFGGEGRAYKVSGGLHGVGVSAVNALSSFMKAEVYREGKLYIQEYARGKALSPLKSAGATHDKGTAITFEADPEIFSVRNFSWDTILDHLRQQAYLTKGVKITVCDFREDSKNCYTFYFEGGIQSFVRHINKNRTVFNDPPAYFEKQADKVQVEIALAYTEDYNEHVFSFANNIYTSDGGTHLTGFRSALTRALNDYAKKNEFIKNEESVLSGDDTREGLTAVISVKLPDPQFEGQTKARLGNPEIKNIVEQAVLEGMSFWLDEHPADARRIIEKCSLSLRARLAAKAARETVIRKGALEGMTLPGKLADCSSRDPKKSELYIVEGDSAGGCFSGYTKLALTDGRNSSFKELIEEDKKGKINYCYTLKQNGNIAVEKILSPRITKRNAQVIEIILDNNEKIICTPDHRFMLRDGSYRMAKDLKNNHSLMPLRRKISKLRGRITIEGYEMIFNPKDTQWIFTHLLADKYNLEHKAYTVDKGQHKHHVDFNKLNNNPENIKRIPKENHLQIHQAQVKLTLHRPDVIEKCNALKRKPEYRKKISQTMSSMKRLLSTRAKKQWQDPAYKEYMLQKFLDFYHNNRQYRLDNLERLNAEQKKYWSSVANRERQSLRVKNFFESHPELKENLSQIAKKQWLDQNLLEWRRNKTKKQWTKSFRTKREIAYNKVYLNSSLVFAKKVYEKNGKIDSYDRERIIMRKTPKRSNILKLTTLIERFFDGDRTKLFEAVKNYNHKIKSIKFLSKRIDVYDCEVPKTHNFALSSGVFVHNSAKQGRDRTFQAILPLRGKILNVERARLDKMLSSEEIKALIVALGVGIGEVINMVKLRYHRIIIMTDADVDGSHIRTLLLTLFYRHFPKMIESDNLYIAQPPLYALTRGKIKEFAYNEEQKEKLVKKIGEGVQLQRYKGLGEMTPTQLWETTMNPENRVLLQVKIEDAEKADEIFSMLMGDEVGPRKRFIQTHAKYVKNLDV